MGRRRSAAVSALALVLAFVAGCGGNPSAPSAPATATTAPTATGTPQEQALAWTESVCGALVPVVARLTAAPGIETDAPEATRQAWLTYLDDGLAVTEQARQTVAAAGPAPVAGGDAIADQVRGDLADLQADIADARTQVERADPGSATGVVRALVSGSRVLGALVNGAQVAGRLNRDPALRDAYAHAPSCAQLQRAGAPATAAPTAPPPTG